MDQAAASMSEIEAHLEAVTAVYDGSTPIKIRLIIFNRSENHLAILKWQTPLEGIRSNCLTVLREEMPVQYDGVLIKRGRPSASSFVPVAPGKTLTVDFDLDQAYDVTKPGKYEVSLQTVVRIIPIPPDSADLVALAKADVRRMKERTLVGGGTHFTVAPGIVPRPPLGARQRAVERIVTDTDSDSRADEAEPGAARPPKFIGGTSDQQAKGKTAHDAGYQLCLGAIARLSPTDGDYITWFGKYDSTRLDKVAGNFVLIRDKMQSSTFTYNLTCDGCDPGDIAYTYDDSMTIWLCKDFWPLPASGENSQAGTVLHEQSHTTAHTDDVPGADDPSGCKSLAKSDPGKAIKNADNYEYYGRG